MKVTYDKSVDTMYIRLNEKLAYRSSKKVSDDIVIDYSEDGKIIGVEVLTASQNTILPQTAIPVELSPARS